MRRRRRDQTPGRTEPEVVQLVGFRIRNEEFAFPIQDVREVDKMTTVTPVPQAPAAVAGMVDVRGEVIPVISLRDLFGLAAEAPGPKSRIIFVELPGADATRKRVVGCIVDSLSRVLRLPKNSVSSVPPELLGEHRRYLEGVARLDGRLIMILRAARLVPASALEGVAS